MRLAHLTLRCFRAHAASAFDPAPGVTLFHGPNGVGKTNVLEAVHYLGLTKSFVTSSDDVAIRVGCGQAEVTGAFEGERRGAFRVRLALGAGQGKRVSVGGVPVPSLAEHIGRVPLVVMAPQDYVLTSGPPDERRRFLDTLLSQARPLYLQDRMRFGRALKQRTELLAAARHRRYTLSTDLLDAWTDEVVALGARVVHARARALDDFHAYLDRAYAHLGESVETPSFAYDGPVSVEAGATVEDVAEALRQRIAVMQPRERETGRSLVGPHRDDVTFRLGTFEVRRYASQGQHRTFGIALRLAQWLYLHELTGESPILLLDDLFGSLDAARTQRLVALLLDGALGQALVTHPGGDLFGAALDGTHHRAIDLSREDLNRAGAPSGDASLPSLSPSEDPARPTEEALPSDGVVLEDEAVEVLERPDEDGGDRDIEGEDA